MTNKNKKATKRKKGSDSSPIENEQKSKVQVLNKRKETPSFEEIRSMAMYNGLPIQTPNPMIAGGLN